MFQPTAPVATTKAGLYDELARGVAALVHDERDPIANAANISSLLFHMLPDLNWAGFYFLKGEELVLGPFQGKPACIRIALGRGVCGTAAATRSAQIVDDVDAFPGHITCDAASRSEIVLPIVAGGHLIGVLDVDSPLPGRFDEDDRCGLERIVAEYVASSDIS